MDKSKKEHVDHAMLNDWALEHLFGITKRSLESINKQKLSASELLDVRTKIASMLPSLSVTLDKEGNVHIVAKEATNGHVEGRTSP